MFLVRNKRERSRPSFFGAYARFWRGCEWLPFLLPNSLGFELACQRLQTHVDIRELLPKPGVYEFAISKGTERRYKTYVGESGSIRKRHMTYAKNGDHLLSLFDTALRSGCVIWRRCRYVETKQKAVKWEAKFLKKYDYAWNAQQNQRKRAISLVSRSFCLCMSSLQVVEGPPIRSPRKQQKIVAVQTKTVIMSPNRLSPANKFSGKVSKTKTVVIQQKQFVVK